MPFFGSLDGYTHHMTAYMVDDTQNLDYEMRVPQGQAIEGGCYAKLSPLHLHTSLEIGF